MLAVGEERVLSISFSSETACVHKLKLPGARYIAQHIKTHRVVSYLRYDLIKIK